MDEHRLAGIADILPPAPPSVEAAGPAGWWLLLLPLCAWLWYWWRRQGRTTWRLWWLERRVSRGTLAVRVAADRLAVLLRGRALQPGFVEQLDRARFAAASIAPDDFVGLLRQLKTRGERHGR